MTKTTWYIIGGITLAAGVGGYFWWKKIKKDASSEIEIKEALEASVHMGNVVVADNGTIADGADLVDPNATKAFEAAKNYATSKRNLDLLQGRSGFSITIQKNILKNNMEKYMAEITSYGYKWVGTTSSWKIVKI